ncbi:MAG: PDZ domain-containing protein [Clostridium sartagoforme]|jgi:serine protease Do|nr:PDZ domain-containing protein [Clostridium sartagoforme]
MDKKIKDEFENEEKFMCEYLPSIQFKRRKIKSNIKLISKIISLLVVAGISGAVFSNLAIQNKYKNLIDKFDERIEKSAIILNYSKIIEKVKQSLVTISDNEENLSKNKYFENNVTGIIVESNGKILTNYSKIENLKDIYVKLPMVGVKPVKAKLIVGNEDMDMAIIQVEYNEELKPIKLAEKSDIVEGIEVALISNSTGDEYIDSIIPGIITSTNRILNSNHHEYKILETNIPITPINTGGVISNSNGELVGLSSYKVTKNINQNGLYYANNLNSIEEIINSTNEIGEKLGILEGGFLKSNVVGFYVAEIKQDSNGYESGLRPTDIIMSIDGNPINSMSQLTEVLKAKKTGDTLKCKVMRSGKVEDLEIKLDINK